MSDQLITAMVSVVLGIIGLAALATVLSPKAYTSQVINAASSGLSNNILAATSPVTGNTGNSMSSMGSLSLGNMGNGL